MVVAVARRARDDESGSADQERGRAWRSP
ncbi:MAG: hypothetical protein JWL93_2299, partial [Hyphomicrobiales bacterium]|nr:hypothetical protein [Hyphomicrobiales bacterium]